MNTLPDELRIPFKRNVHTVTEDQKTFMMWNQREITSAQAAYRIGRANNCLVTIEQFEANAKWLGYLSGQKWPL